MNKQHAMKMPEFLIFSKMFAIGIIGAEVFRITFYLGTNLAKTLQDIPVCFQAIAISTSLALCLTYAIKRNAHSSGARIIKSYRVDLLVAVLIGIWSNELASPWLAKLHTACRSADPYWALIILILLSSALLSPLVQHYWIKPKKKAAQLYFIADEEIDNTQDDLFSSETRAKSFADTVLASGAHSGLVFGVDGPWGVGKTSFINLAERHWKSAADKVIVCRFEPLRYASEPNLADRLIRDLSAVIQSKVFAPEFRPAATRYSRLIKGKADFSFLGFKLSLNPSQETVDELLEDIDEVLRRIDRRIIIVIDDLDRLDAKTINNVLFATRQTFKLSQATYILCYDTEILAGSKADGPSAREFLEKFVTVKLSLFVDSSKLREFLLRDWASDESQLGSVPSDTMIKLGSILNELAEILNGNLASNYLPLVGDLRKVKRFVNAILMMQIEKTDLGRTDFNQRDLINLVLLHLNYPGIFRRIYAEETEGRKGTFSLQRESGESEFKNTETFVTLQQELERPAWFLLAQLFDAETLKVGEGSNIEEQTLRSRACFNSGEFRNLEAYLKLIVRLATPEPQNTFILYQNAVEQVRQGASIASVLTSSDFDLRLGEHTHDQFWRVLINQSYNFTNTLAKDSIETLIEYLPHYSAFDNDDRGLRQRSIYALLRLIDHAGWGRTAGRRLPNTPNNVIEIAWRLFGENADTENGLLEQLVNPNRGVLGWNDLMLFRLQCSADRGGQLFNLHAALIVHQDMDAATSGDTRNLALMGMRKLSQKIFAIFKRTYIEPQRNFFSDVNNESTEAFLGIAYAKFSEEASKHPRWEHSYASIAQRIMAARSVVKTFVIYQLSNSLPPTGSGVGCGYYDEEGMKDDSGIAEMMNSYIFNVCFNPNINESNILLFVDYCLSNLSSAFFSGHEEEGYLAMKEKISGGLNPKDMGRYWQQHRRQIRELNLHNMERSVVTPNYIAFYRDDLDGVFAVLDDLVEEA